eukprot:357054-Chlamydomonas_euryale.AAC.1
MTAAPPCPCVHAIAAAWQTLAGNSVNGMPVWVRVSVRMGLPVPMCISVPMGLPVPMGMSVTMCGQVSVRVGAAPAPYSTSGCGVPLAPHSLS